MNEQFEFVPSGDPQYPYRAIGLMPTADFLQLSSLPAELVSSTTDHFEIDVWKGDGVATIIYENGKPVKPGKKRKKASVSHDQYLEALSEQGLPLPPTQWRPMATVFTEVMEMLTSVERDEANTQRRVVNTQQRREPESVAGIKVVSFTKDYMRAVEEAGIPPSAARDGVIFQNSPALEVVAKKALVVVRALGGLRRIPEGQLIRTLRTEKSLQAIRK